MSPGVDLEPESKIDIGQKCTICTEAVFSGDVTVECVDVSQNLAGITSRANHLVRFAREKFGFAGDLYFSTIPEVVSDDPKNPGYVAGVNNAIREKMAFGEEFAVQILDIHAPQFDEADHFRFDTVTISKQISWGFGHKIRDMVFKQFSIDDGSAAEQMTESQEEN